MPALVAYGHSKGVEMGFYLNGCGCNEKDEKEINYEGDVRATVSWGFDAAKIDSCGAQKNMSLYYNLFNESGTAIELENCHQGQNITDGGNPDQMGPGWCPYNIFRSSGDIVNVWDRVMSNLMSVAPWLEMRATGGTQFSRPSCWAYPDMLEVGRMPEHNEEESRSHLAAWAVVSAPLVLGFDLTNEERFRQAWPMISNSEVIEISQTWVAEAPWPSGRLIKQWQAPNVPTFEVRGGCGNDACADDDPKCEEWAEDKQCELNPSYMKKHCQRSCGTCPHGNFTAFRFDGSTLRQGTLCLDTDGQLPAGHDGSNELHALPCLDGKASQRWSFNGTSGAIHAQSGGICLRVFDHWLWDHPIVDAAAPCDPGAPGANQAWSLHANGTLANAQYGCIEISGDSGPPSTIWVKPLEEGRMALLAINGADMPQVFALNFTELVGAPSWQARDVWAKDDLGTLSRLTRNVSAHDCLLLVLSPQKTDDRMTPSVA